MCLHNQENEILTEQEELISLEQVFRRLIATEKEEIERLRAEIADIQRSDKDWAGPGLLNVLWYDAQLPLHAVTVSTVTQRCVPQSSAGPQ